MAIGSVVLVHCISAAFVLACAFASSTCQPDESVSGTALLQARQRTQFVVPTSTGVVASKASEKVVLQDSHATLDATKSAQGPSPTARSLSSVNESAVLNPSGAAAPLSQAGYGAVADRCCQKEMMTFIDRQITNLGLEVCKKEGLVGIVPYHSCGLGPATFDKLTADLLEDSTSRCTWLAKTGQCKPNPDDCPDYAIAPELFDCGCSRSKAAKLDIAASTLTMNNLGGLGPMNTSATNPTGVQELRYAGGISSTGEPFDLVVIALSSGDTYDANKPENNGKSGAFGQINMRSGRSVDFQFSFVVPGTMTPVVVPEVHMAMFDLDGGPGDGEETAASKLYAGYVTDESPSVTASLLPDGRTMFTSPGGPVKNPFNPNVLTAEQRRNSVMYFYTSVSGFFLNFGIQGQGYSGRNLFFAFESSLNDRCAA